MVSFIALYRGRSLSEAQLVGVSVRRDLIQNVSEVMLDDLTRGLNDPIIASISNGRRKALEMIRREFENPT